MSKRLFITGIGGFVGKYLSQELCNRDFAITGMLAPGESLTPGVAECCQSEVVADLLDISTLEMALREHKPEVIVHLAAASAPSKSFAAPRFFYDLNVRGTQQLMEAIRRHSPESRLVLFSSSEVYGYVTPEELPLRESSQLRPANPYAVTKVACHMHARQYALNFGLSITEVRPFNMIGPNQTLGFVLPDFASQVAEIIAGNLEPTIKVGRLSDQRDFLDIRDAVRAIADVVQYGHPGETYNICSGRSVSVSHLLDLLLENAAMKIHIEQDEARMRPSKMPTLYGCNSKVSALAGWSPQVPLQQTVAETLQYWQNQ